MGAGTAVAITSLGSAFFFLILYHIFPEKGMKGLLKPLFFMLSLFFIIEGVYNIKLAALADYGANEISTLTENFFFNMLLWFIYFIIAATVIDLMFILIKTIFFGER